MTTLLHSACLRVASVAALAASLMVACSDGNTPTNTDAETNNLDPEKPDSCRDHDDQSPTGNVTVIFENRTSQRIYAGNSPFSACPLMPMFTIESLDGEKREWMDNECDLECDEARAGNLRTCVYSCALAELVALDPGQRYEISWNGLVTLPRELPLECVPEEARESIPTGIDTDNDTVRCSQRVPIEGPHRFAARAWKNCPDCPTDIEPLTRFAASNVSGELEAIAEFDSSADEVILAFADD